jgi:hypothetical protein
MKSTTTATATDSTPLALTVSDDSTNSSIAIIDGDDDNDNPHDQDASNVLYHDILMHVFTFLTAPSLANFSQTARRPNFEVFYYLQLQLQRALVVVVEEDPCTTTTFTSTTAAATPVVHTSSFGDGSARVVSRFASLQPTQAQQIVREFGDSNATLRTSMPLSHSLAYLRHVLQRHGLLLDQHQPPAAPARALAGAAFLVTVVGAVVLKSSDASPHELFRVGAALTMGGLMGAKKLERDLHEKDDHPSLARLVQALGTILPTAADDDNNSTSQDPIQQQQQQPWTPNPYEHLPSDLDAVTTASPPQEKQKDPQPSTTTKKMPSGCVGAYSQAITKATNGVTQYIKDQRQVKFDALSTDEQYQLSSHFLDACTSNDTLPLVQQMIHAMNVDGFFMGLEDIERAAGTETCALHTAAFHGAHKVLEFLCQSIHATDSTQDGGLANVNLKDTNGWTALHFAAGANSVETVQVLVQHGALLNMEANNGYTPLEWAIRLSNVKVAEELQLRQRILAAAGAESSSSSLAGAWWNIPTMVQQSAAASGSSSSQPLSSMIANRFFSLIPTH